MEIAFEDENKNQLSILSAHTHTDSKLCIWTLKMHDNKCELREKTDENSKPNTIMHMKSIEQQMQQHQYKWKRK